jgi:hypothetical protein
MVRGTFIRRFRCECPIIEVPRTIYSENLNIFCKLYSISFMEKSVIIKVKVKMDTPNLNRLQMISN